MGSHSWGREFLFSRAIGTAKKVVAEKKGILSKDVNNLAIIPFGDVGLSIITKFAHDTLLEEKDLVIFPSMTVQDLAAIALTQVLNDLRPPATSSLHT